MDMPPFEQIVKEVSTDAANFNMQPQFIAFCWLIAMQKETNDILKSLLINIKQIKEGLIKNEK